MESGDDRDPRGIPVFCEGEYQPFGELTAAAARRRGEELAEAGSWGPLAKVAGVSAAWRELARRMDADGAARVADLDREEVAAFARRLWIVPPRGSLL